MILQMKDLSFTILIQAAGLILTALDRHQSLLSLKSDAGFCPKDAFQLKNLLCQSLRESLEESISPKLADCIFNFLKISN